MLKLLNGKAKGRKQKEENKRKKTKGRWKTNIGIFQDLEIEDLLAYLIIKGKPKERTNEDEFNWR
jgi:hypothetical protein